MSELQSANLLLLGNHTRKSVKKTDLLSENANYTRLGVTFVFDIMEISISKEVLPSIEEFGFEETILGDPKDSLKQYRNSTGLHAREYEDRFVIHRDQVDPRIDPLGHLMKDSPETLFSLGGALIASRKARAESTRNSLNPFAFIIAFVTLNRIFRLIKRLL